MVVKRNEVLAPVRVTGLDQVTRTLQAAGIRSTSQRRAVVGSMIGCNDAMTAQELHAHLRRTGHTVSLNTVYRTLGALAEAGAIHTFPRQGEIAFRRCSDSQHQHLICTGCGRVDDVTVDAIENWVAALARSSGYTVRGQRTDVYGVCPSC